MRLRESIMVLVITTGFVLIGTAAPAVGDCPQFHDGVHYPLGGSPNSLAIGDLNGDGVLDLALGGSSVRVLLGLGDGTFAAVEGQAFFGSSVALGDLNGDQVLDVVVVDFSTVYIGLGIGDGSFAAPFSYGVSDQAKSVAIGFLNKDDYLDLAVAGGFLFESEVAVLFGFGDGEFASPDYYSLGAIPENIVIADLRNDNGADLVIGESFNNHIHVLGGHSDGSFSGLSGYDTEPSPNEVAVGDLNGDAVPDLVAVSTGGVVSVLIAVQGVPYADAVDYIVGGSLESIAIGDLDGDQVPDLAVANDETDDVWVLLGVGDGTFDDAVAYAVGEGPNAVAIGDLDGDKMLDLIVANRDDHTVTVLLNQGHFPCEGDANGDGLVDPLDSGFIMARFGCSVGTGDPDCDTADMNGDALVDPLDAGFVLARFGTCP